ncbi:glycosyltransferase [Pseudonocardia sp. NPDC049635]|uniref:glycosyltransferase n=1 Tax=Pseudonocardia sp. NPDC049635 TaxID=3155506 RepID=UPI0033D06F22
MSAAAPGTVVYYVHHHGSGHAHRASAIAARCRSTVVGVGSRPAPAGWPGAWHELPLDTDGVDGPATRALDVTAGGTLHWAPRDHPGLRARAAAVSGLLAAGPARLLVADVSVEMALLARLHGVPVAVVLQPGDRRDRPHRMAHDLAEVLLAPWPARPARPDLAGRIVHLGGLSRYDDRAPVPPPGGRRVLVLTGSGDAGVDPAAVASAAAATPDWTWAVAGSIAGALPSDAPPNLEPGGWTGDVWAALCAADVVVGHAGQNVVAEIAAARRPAVIIPADRPYGEQVETGGVLDDAGLATVRTRWPEPRQWPRLLAEACARGGQGWVRWSDGRAAERAADVLDRIAAGGAEPGP